MENYIADLKAYVNASDSDLHFITKCEEEATVLVENFIGISYVPETVRIRAIIEVGSELFHRRQSPQGVAQYATMDSAPIRINRDPMVGAYPILKPFVGLGIG